jgi:hypothetical protein
VVSGQWLVVSGQARCIALCALLVACGEGPKPAAMPSASGSGGANVTGGSAGAGGSAAGASAGGGAGGVSGGTGGAGGSGGAADDCAAMPASLLCAPMGKLPASIKDTGLFPMAPDLTKHSPRLLEYVPDPPLWSDGMEKQRFLLLPMGQKIDNSDRTKWAFPEGTILVKTFFDDSGPAGASRPIETRLIRAGANNLYEFFLYQWNQDSTDATLVVDDINGDINLETPVIITIDHMVGGQPLVVNGGQPFSHVLPSRNACGECHEKNGTVTQTVIGFDELRLNAKRDAAAPTTQLQAFADAGVFTMPPPADAATIADADARLLRIKRFVFGNCVTCHNGNGNFDLRPDVLVENTVGKPTESQSVEPPEGWLRVVPGDPQTSVLYVQMQRTMLPEPVGNASRLRPMPPVGLADVAVEQSSLKDVFDWITALPPQ